MAIASAILAASRYVLAKMCLYSKFAVSQQTTFKRRRLRNEQAPKIMLLFVQWAKILWELELELELEFGNGKQTLEQTERQRERERDKTSINQQSVSVTAKN